MNYYNEIEKFPAQWLRNLSDAGHISKGYVDERSIIDVKPEDLRGYKQCHFFAGIGVWSHALRLAGWSDDKEVWTGSCPCQPFSAAGKRGGTADARHLWPEWFRLIKECRPRVIFGEQVASKDGLAWLDIVYADLEAEGYTVGAVDICAAGVGAPHLRQRLYFVAHTELHGRYAECEPGGAKEEGGLFKPEGCCTTRIVADTIIGGFEYPTPDRGEGREEVEGSGSNSCIVANTRIGNPRSSFGKGDNGGWSDDKQDDRDCVRDDSGDCKSACFMGNSDIDYDRGKESGCCCQKERVQEVDREEHLSPRKSGGTGIECCTVDQPDSQGLQGDEFGGTLQEVRSETRNAVGKPGPTNGFWADAVWLPCRDGKSRPTGVWSMANTSPRNAQSGGASPCGSGELDPEEREAKDTEAVGGRGDESGVVREGGVFRQVIQDGKVTMRSTESFIQPLAHGVTQRVGRLRAYGNAIVAPVAQEFIMAYMEVRGDT